MATTLFLRSTETNSLSTAGTIYYDMTTTAGSSAVEGVVDTVAGPATIQWTLDTTGDVEIQWISGYTPVGGFTLTSITASVWAIGSSHGEVLCRARFFKRAGVDGSEVEIAGGPFDDGTNIGGAYGEMGWVANVTDTAFLVDDRLIVKLYITDGAPDGMDAGGTCTMKWDAASGAQGDSFITLAETVAFTETPNNEAMGCFTF